MWREHLVLVNAKLGYTLSHTLTQTHTQQGQLPLEAHLEFISCRRQQAITGVAWQPLVIGLETKGGAKTTQPFELMAYETLFLPFYEFCAILSVYMTHIS